MSKSKPTYEQILEQLEKLQTENKRLRLRPSFNSSEANILDFMNIKRNLAQSILKSINLNEALNISLSLLRKIKNIHSVSFFIKKKNEEEIDIISKDGIPKRMISEIKLSENKDKYVDILFPKESIIHFEKNIEENNSRIPNFFLNHVQRYKTIIIIPVLKNTDIEISIILMSQKAFDDDKFIKVLYQSVQAQLNSSFYRIILSEKLNIQAEDLNKSIKERTHGFEKMNFELMSQIKTHRQKEQDISEELSLYKSIILQQKDLVLRINKEGQILYFNPQFSKVHMVLEGAKENIANYFGNGDFPGLDFINWDFERNVQRVSCEIQLSFPHWEWYNFNFSPIKNKRGLITEIQIVARNITRIKNLEKRLRYQKRMLLNMINYSENVSVIINNTHQVEFISDNWETLTGHSATKTTNQKLIEYAHPEDNEKIKEKLSPLYSGDVNECNFDCRFLFADKSWHNTHVELKAIIDKEGELTYFVGNLVID